MSPGGPRNESPRSQSSQNGRPSLRIPCIQTMTWYEINNLTTITRYKTIMQFYIKLQMEQLCGQYDYSHSNILIAKYWHIVREFVRVKLKAERRCTRSIIIYLGFCRTDRRPGTTAVLEFSLRNFDKKRRVLVSTYPRVKSSLMCVEILRTLYIKSNFPPSQTDFFIKNISAEFHYRKVVQTPNDYAGSPHKSFL